VGVPWGGRWLRGALFEKVSLGTFLTDLAPASWLFMEAGFAIVEQRDFRGFLFVHFAFDCAVKTGH
jgi:hypothetical protein